MLSNNPKSKNYLKCVSALRGDQVWYSFHLQSLGLSTLNMPFELVKVDRANYLNIALYYIIMSICRWGTCLSCWCCISVFIWMHGYSHCVSCCRSLFCYLLSPSFSLACPSVLELLTCCLDLLGEGGLVIVILLFA